MDLDLDSIRVLTEHETIRAIGVSDRTWDRLKAIGDVPHKTRLSQGRVGYRVADIKVWLNGRREGMAS
jgi:predicted DNA-binding transcriptional regulator AlpA